MELRYIVYITINLCNGKFYIGVHRTNPNVFDGYIGNGIYRESDAKKKDYAINRPFANAVLKYGYNNFKRTTISIFPNTEDGRNAAYILEAQIVTQTLINSKQCYNVQPGGIISRHITKPVYKYDNKGKFIEAYPSTLEAVLKLNKVDNVESARKIIGKCCRGETTSAFGFVWSYDSKFKQNPNMCKKIAQYTISGKFIRTFNNIIEAQEEIHLKGIYQAISKKSSLGGFQWRYYNNDSSDIKPLINRTSKSLLYSIVVLNTDDKELMCFNNLNECIKIHPEWSKRQIQKCLNNKIKTHKGYKFKYKIDDIV